MSSIPEHDLDHLRDEVLSTLRQHWKLFLIQGIVFIVLGLLAIVVPGVATVAAELLLGVVLLVSGLVQVFATLASRSAPGFWMALLSGLLSVVAGFLLLAYPLTGVLTLTLVLVAFLLVEGIFEIVLAVRYSSLPNRGWLFAGGVVTVILAVLVWAGWPSTATWFLGLMIGINFLFYGWALTTMALAVRPRDTMGEKTREAP